MLATLALAAVQRIDAISSNDREMNGLDASARLAIRREHLVPLVAGLETWMPAERAELARYADLAKAFD